MFLNGNKPINYPSFFFPLESLDKTYSSDISIARRHYPETRLRRPTCSSRPSCCGHFTTDKMSVGPHRQDACATADARIAPFPYAFHCAFDVPPSLRYGATGERLPRRSFRRRRVGRFRDEVAATHSINQPPKAPSRLPGLQALSHRRFRRAGFHRAAESPNRPWLQEINRLPSESSIARRCIARRCPICRKSGA